MSTTPKEIPKTWVDETWQHIGGIQDAMAATKLSQSFTQKQPALADFILTFSKDLSSDAHELAYYIGLVVWHCYEGYFKQGLRKVTSGEVIKLHKEMETWLEGLEQTDDRFIAKRIMNQADYEQRHIFQYIVEAIFESGDEDIQLTDDDIGALFMILKVHMDCLDSAVRAEK